MAQSEIEIKVSVENAIHNSLRETLQYVAKEYGLTVQSISVEWIESLGVPPRIRDMTITTRTGGS